MADSLLYNKAEKARDIQENWRIYNCMLREWKKRDTDAHIAKLVAVQERIIADATNEIAKYYEWRAKAPAKIAEYEELLEECAQSEVIINHQDTIDKITALQEQMAVYQEKLKAMGIDPNAQLE